MFVIFYKCIRRIEPKCEYYKTTDREVASLTQRKYQSSECSKTKIELKIPEINDFGQVPTCNVYHEKKTIKLNTLQNSYNFVSRSSFPSESAIPSPDYGRSVETMTDPCRTPIDREHIDIQK